MPAYNSIPEHMSLRIVGVVCGGPGAARGSFSRRAGKAQKAGTYPFCLRAECLGMQEQSGWRWILAGPHGLRAGWRLLMFLVILGALPGGFALVYHGGPQGVREAYSKMAETTATPWLPGGSDAVSFAFLCIPTHEKITTVTGV